MFVFLLGIYVIQELSVDKFHEKKDRIYLLVNSTDIASVSNPVGDYVQSKLPEIESYTRVLSRNVNFKYGETNTFYEAMFADSTFFNIFSFDLIDGNPDNVLKSKQNVVLTQSFANKIFPDINPLGKTFQVDDIEVIVSGIMKDFPSNTHLPECDFILNYGLITNYWGEDILQDWGNSSFVTYLLLKEGADINSKKDFLLELFKQDYWVYEMGYYDEVTFVPVDEIYFNNFSTGNIGFNSNSKSLIYIYFAITILILMVAILNYINLTVSQSSFRGKETAIRKLLGSSQKSIISQFISESIMMALLASVLGILLAFAAKPFFNNIMSTNLDISQYVTPLNILIVITGIVVIGIVSGLFPAIVVSQFKPIEVVKGTYKLKVKTLFSKVLITFQYLVAISLLICSIFLIKQTNYLKDYNLGYDTGKVFVMKNIFDQEKIEGLKNELFKIPGVENVSYSAGTPFDGGNNQSFEYEGEPLSFQVFQVDSAFFDVYGIKLFPFEDINGNSVWVNQQGLNALHLDSTNRSFKYWDQDLYISGTTNDFNFRSLHTPVGPSLIIYYSELNYRPWHISVKIASSANTFETADRIKETYTEYSNGELFDSFFADEVIQKQYEGENKISKIIIAFTVLTIIILMMGILAMSLYYVNQKEKEIAIRKANGAKEKEIIYMLNMNFIKWIIVAFVLAIPLSYFAMQKWLESFPYKISLTWWIFIMAGIVIILLSAVFVTLQSWKTATSNPVNALKNE
jgi:putative ABC transport system permease protein